MYKVVESEHESYCSSPANENWDQGVEGGEAWEADMSKTLRDLSTSDVRVLPQ